MDAEGLNITCGAVCVYPSRVKETVAFLAKYGAGQVRLFIYGVKPHRVKYTVFFISQLELRCSK